jgi:hypothetical protein
MQDKGGLYRWYNDYVLPASYGGGTVTVSSTPPPRTGFSAIISAGSALVGAVENPKRAGSDRLSSVSERVSPIFGTRQAVY